MSVQPLPVVFAAPFQSTLHQGQAQHVPSLGSTGHQNGSCKPCVFFHTRGCKSGSECQFCHFCGPDEKKTRQKAKRLHFQELRSSARGQHADQQCLQTDLGSSYQVSVTPPREDTLIASQVMVAGTGTAMPSQSPVASAAKYRARRPGLLQLPEDEHAAGYVVRNTFIEAPSGIHASPVAGFASREILSCPATKIGRLWLDMPTVCDDTDTSSTCDLSLRAVDSPQSLVSMLWPATPEPTAPEEHALPQHSSWLVSTLEPTSKTGFAAPALQIPTNAGAFTFDVSPPVYQPVQEMQAHPQPVGSRVLSLAQMLDSPAEADSVDTLVCALPSVGSALHSYGACKPCGFFHKNGCQAGAACTFCHFCDSGEKKRRQREKREAFRHAERQQVVHAAAARGGA